MRASSQFKIHERNKDQKKIQSSEVEYDRMKLKLFPIFGSGFNIMESSILAQNERWRRVLSMQVEREAGAIWWRAADG